MAYLSTTTIITQRSIILLLIRTIPFSCFLSPAFALVSSVMVVNVRMRMHGLFDFVVLRLASRMLVQYEYYVYNYFLRDICCQNL